LGPEEETTIEHAHEIALHLKIGVEPWAREARGWLLAADCWLGQRTVLTSIWVYVLGVWL
jgi:hypothetical protein